MKFKENAIYRIVEWGDMKPITWCFDNVLIFNGKYFKDTYWSYQPTVFDPFDIKGCKLKIICDDITKMKEVDLNEFKLYKAIDKLQIYSRGDWKYLIKEGAIKSIKLFKDLVKCQIKKLVREIKYHQDDIAKWEEILIKAKKNDMTVLNTYIPSEFELYEEDSCDWWEEDKDELSEDEKRDIIGDRKAHEIFETEGHVE